MLVGMSALLLAHATHDRDERMRYARIAIDGFDADAPAPGIHFALEAIAKAGPLMSSDDLPVRQFSAQTLHAAPSYEYAKEN